MNCLSVSHLSVKFQVDRLWYKKVTKHPTHLVVYLIREWKFSNFLILQSMDFKFDREVGTDKHFIKYRNSTNFPSSACGIA